MAGAALTALSFRRAPIPIGPASYVRRRRKSTPRSWTSTLMCGTLCAPSPTRITPWRWQISAKVFKSFLHPSTLEIWVIAAIFVCGGDHVLEALCRDRAVHVAFQVFHGRTVTLCGLLPWKNVAVMFHDADDDRHPVLTGTRSV